MYLLIRVALHPRRRRALACMIVTPVLITGDLGFDPPSISHRQSDLGGANSRADDCLRRISTFPRRRATPRRAPAVDDERYISAKPSSSSSSSRGVSERVVDEGNNNIAPRLSSFSGMVRGCIIAAWLHKIAGGLVSRYHLVFAWTVELFNTARRS